MKDCRIVQVKIFSTKFLLLWFKVKFQHFRLTFPHREMKMDAQTGAKKTFIKEDQINDEHARGALQLTLETNCEKIYHSRHS